MTYSNLLCDLKGAGILVTRAAHQAEPLCRLIADCGGRPVRFPALEITGPPYPARTRALLAAVVDFDIAIFISPNAVAMSLELLPAPPLPATLSIAAVGQGTADRLSRAGIGVSLVPDNRFDSEALLDMAALRQPAGKRVLIVRGEGGRGLLGDTLVERGAEVTYAEVYRRRCPDSDPAPLLQTWQRDIALVTATSGEILANLFRLLGPAGTERLRETPLVVVSERMRIQAREGGCRRVGVARRADDLSVLAAVCELVGAPA